MVYWPIEKKKKPSTKLRGYCCPDKNYQEDGIDATKSARLSFAEIEAPICRRLDVPFVVPSGYD